MASQVIDFPVLSSLPESRQSHSSPNKAIFKANKISQMVFEFQVDESIIWHS